MLIDLKPSAEDRLKRALEYHNGRQFAAAATEYEAVLAEEPDNINAIWNYGRMLHFCKSYKAAAKQYERLLLMPKSNPELRAHALNNLGLIVQLWGHWDKAEQSFRYALQLHPTHQDAMVNYGVCRRHAGDFKTADSAQTTVLRWNPKKPEANCEAAFLSLTTGDLVRGFQKYEWRWKWNAFTTRRLRTNRPKWNGQSLNGKTILLTHEQGLGDSMQFIRYAKMVKSRGGMVHYWGPPEVVDLCASAPGVDRAVCAHDETDDYFDYHCPLLSLPRIFRTSQETIPAEVPYLSVDGEAQLKGDFKVGLVWAGRPEHGGDRWRSMTIDQFAPLLEVPGVTWYSLQYGERANGVERYPQVTDLRPLMSNFCDTGRLLNALDLLISVDTSVVHLAGALGRPVWTLLPFSPDWRWMLERSDSPWYPTMKLWRQEKKGEWGPVVERVRAALAARIADGKI